MAAERSADARDGGAESALRERSQMIGALQRHVSDLSNAEGVLKREIAALKDELASVRADHAERERDFAERAAKWQKFVEGVEAERRAGGESARDLERLKDLISKQDEKIELLQAQLAEPRAEAPPQPHVDFASLREECAALRNAKDAAEVALKDAQTAFSAQLRSTIARLNDGAPSEDKVARLLARVGELEAALRIRSGALRPSFEGGGGDLFKERAVKAEARVVELTDELKKVESALASLRAERGPAAGGVGGDAARLNLELDAAKRQLAEAKQRREADVAKFESALRAKAADATVAERARDELARRLDEALGEVGRLRALLIEHDRQLARARENQVAREGGAKEASLRFAEENERLRAALAAAEEALRRGGGGARAAAAAAAAAAEGATREGRLVRLEGVVAELSKSKPRPHDGDFSVEELILKIDSQTAEISRLEALLAATKFEFDRRDAAAASTARAAEEALGGERALRQAAEEARAAAEGEVERLLTARTVDGSAAARAIADVEGALRRSREGGAAALAAALAERAAELEGELAASRAEAAAGARKALAPLERALADERARAGGLAARLSAREFEAASTRAEATQMREEAERTGAALRLRMEELSQEVEAKSELLVAATARAEAAEAAAARARDASAERSGQIAALVEALDALRDGTATQRKLADLAGEVAALRAVEGELMARVASLRAEAERERVRAAQAEGGRRAAEAKEASRALEAEAAKRMVVAVRAERDEFAAALARREEEAAVAAAAAADVRAQAARAEEERDGALEVLKGAKRRFKERLEATACAHEREIQKVRAAVGGSEEFEGAELKASSELSKGTSELSRALRAALAEFERAASAGVGAMLSGAALDASLRLILDLTNRLGGLLLRGADEINAAAAERALFLARAKGLSARASAAEAAAEEAREGAFYFWRRCVRLIAAASSCTPARSEAKPSTPHAHALGDVTRVALDALAAAEAARDADARALRDARRQLATLRADLARISAAPTVSGLPPQVLAGEILASVRKEFVAALDCGDPSGRADELAAAVASWKAEEATLLSSLRFALTDAEAARGEAATLRAALRDVAAREVEALKDEAAVRVAVEESAGVVVERLAEAQADAAQARAALRAVEEGVEDLAQQNARLRATVAAVRAGEEEAMRVAEAQRAGVRAEVAAEAAAEVDGAARRLAALKGSYEEQLRALKNELKSLRGADVVAQSAPELSNAGVQTDASMDDPPPPAAPSRWKRRKCALTLRRRGRMRPLRATRWRRWSASSPTSSRGRRRGGEGVRKDGAAPALQLLRPKASLRRGWGRRRRCGGCA